MLNQSEAAGAGGAMLQPGDKNDDKFLTFRLGDEEALMGRATDGAYAGGMLMRGTERRSRQELMDAIDRLQAQISVSGGATSAQARIETTRANLPEALRLAAEILKEPAFDADEFQVLKNQRVTNAQAQLTEPQPLAVNAFQRAMTPRPADHPEYVPTLEESLERNRDATVEGARSFHQRFYGASDARAAVVGDFDPDQVRAILEEEFGGWRAQSPPARIESDFRPTRGGEESIETPDKANAFLVAGAAIRMDDGHEDYPALALANFMLGGGFLNSRLATRIRQEEGLSYGVGSQLAIPSLDENGLLLAFAISAPENTEKVQEAMLEEIGKILEEGFTEEEIQAAKTGWIDQRRNQRGNDQQLASQLVSRLEADRTFEYDEELEEAVRALSADDIREAFRRYVDPERLFFVKAGDFASVEKPIS